MTDNNLSSLEEEVNQPRKKSIISSVRRVHSEKGDTLVGGLMGVLGVLYSISIPGLLGFKVASGQAPFSIVPLIPGPVLGAFGGTMLGNPGWRYVSGTCAVLEGISFGVGYGIGYLLK